MPRPAHRLPSGEWCDALASAAVAMCESAECAAPAMTYIEALGDEAGRNLVKYAGMLCRDCGQESQAMNWK